MKILLAALLLLTYANWVLSQACDGQPMPTPYTCKMTQTINFNGAMNEMGVSCNIQPDTHTVNFDVKGETIYSKRSGMVNSDFSEIFRNVKTRMTPAKLTDELAGIGIVYKNNFDDVYPHTTINVTLSEAGESFFTQNDSMKAYTTFVQGQNEILTRVPSKTYQEIVANYTTTSAQVITKRDEETYSGTLRGVMGNLMGFSAQDGDSVCGSYFLNATGGDYLVEFPYFWSVKITDMEIIYPVTRQANYGVNLKFGTNCFCHCAYSPKTTCTKNSNNCGSHKICVNAYDGTVNDWSCPMNYWQYGATCCSTYVTDFDIAKAYRVDPPSTVNVKANITLVYYHQPTSTYRTISHSMNVPFSTAMTAQDFYLQTDTGNKFSGYLSMNQIGNLFGYTGGDLLIEDPDGEHKIATGWSDRFDTDASKPGWLKFNDAKSPMYNKNSMLRNMNIKVDNCFKDDFDNDITISESNIEKLPDAVKQFGKYGYPDFRVSEGFISIKPTTPHSVHFSLLLNVTTSAVTLLGSLSGFTCRQKQLSPILLECDLQHFEGSTICFAIETIAEQKIVSISCDNPVTGVAKMIFYLGEYTNDADYLICASGYTNVACARINLSMVNGSTYDPDWVGNTNTTFNEPVPPSWDFFGDTDSWFKNFEDSLKTIFTFVGLAIAGLLALFLFYLFMKYVFGCVKLYKKSKQYSRFKRLHKAMARKDDYMEHKKTDDYKLSQINGQIESEENYEDPSFWEM